MLSFWEPQSPPSLFHSRPADKHRLSEPQQAALVTVVFGIWAFADLACVYTIVILGRVAAALFSLVVKPFLKVIHASSTA